MDGDNNSASETTNDSDNETLGVSKEYSNGTSSISTRRYSEYRGRHEFLADRLQAYSDAVFAIVGTILITYLQQIVPVDQRNVNIRDKAIANISLFTVYHFTFFHVAIIWLNHSRIFNIIERVDDVLVWLNMLLLYVVSFVPLTFGIRGEYRNTYEGIVAPSTTLVAVNIIMIVIVWYAFQRESFLHIELPEKYFTLVRWIMYCNLLFCPLFAVLAIGLGIVNLIVGQVFFYLSTAMLIVPRVIVYIYWKLYRKYTNSQLTYALGLYVSKERTEFFTDGIYSIVATLVIFDITTDGIPSRELVNGEFDGKLVDALLSKRWAYITHFITFLVISLLWFVHHSLFNFVRELNPVMLVIHLLSCSLIGVIPPVIEVLSASFGEENEATAIQMAAMVIAVIGILQLVLLSLMYFIDNECVDPLLFHNKSSLLLFIKVIIVPVTCTISYWCSLGSPELRKYSFYVLYLCSPLTFVLIYFVMSSEKLHSLFAYCWEVQNRLRDMLQRRLSQSYEMDMEMNNRGSQKKQPDRI